MNGPWIRLVVRRRLRLAAFAGLAAVLFSQAALVLAACNLEDGGPSRARAVSMSAAEPVAPCHEEVPAADTLCLAHCQASEQTVDQQPLKAPAVSVAVLPAPRYDVLSHLAPVLPPAPAPAA